MFCLFVVFFFTRKKGCGFGILTPVVAKLSVVLLFLFSRPMTWVQKSKPQKPPRCRYRAVSPAPLLSLSLYFTHAFSFCFRSSSLVPKTFSLVDLTLESRPPNSPPQVTSLIVLGVESPVWRLASPKGDRLTVGT